jgi:endoglucanase
MKALIQKLVEATGPSGFESQVRDLILDEIKNYVDSYEIDSLGSLITTKGKKTKNGLNIMLAAHVDEIGIMVTHIDENGFARFTNVGFIFPLNCTAARVRFLNGARGVIGMEPTSNMYKTNELAKMYIDFGVNKKKECPVNVGDVAAFESTFCDLGNRIVSKAMDDRIGVAVLIQALKEIKDTPNQINAVFTTQEEVGTRGATPAAFSINPDLGLAIDVSPTGDTPKSRAFDVKLGGGPTIMIKDYWMISDPRVVAWMEKSARKIKVPYQREILIRGSTDARAIQLTREGVPAGCLSVPVRYVHSPSEMVDYNDVLNAVKLLVQLLSNPVKLE